MSAQLRAAAGGVIRSATLARREARKRAIAETVGAREGRCTTSDIQSAVGGHHSDVLALIRELVGEQHVIVQQDPADRRRRTYVLAQDYQPPSPAPVPAPPRAKTCTRCSRPLPPHKKRFCSDICRIRKQKAENVIENSTYAAGLVRQIASMGKRASADLDALAWLAGAVDHARDALTMAVDGCRSRGYSDGEIGQALGITRQAVGQRFGRKHGVYAGQQDQEVPA
jgi:DNA-directed RNA polymerase specialized sigma24 family protein